MPPSRHRQSLHVMLSCLFGLLLLAITWTRTIHHAELANEAPAAHADVVVHEDNPSNAAEDYRASLLLEDSGLDDTLYLPTSLDMNLVSSGSAAPAAGPYAVRRRDIALQPRPPEAV
jgi:hypothetical protein